MIFNFNQLLSILIFYNYFPLNQVEIRKLYSQLQQIKTANMVYDNRHLTKSTGQLNDSVVSLAEIGNNFANPSFSPRRSRRNQRLSPAAELASDFV